MKVLSNNETRSTDQLEACLRLLHVVESLEIVSDGLMKECKGEVSRMMLALPSVDEDLDDIPYDGPYCRSRDRNPPGLVWLSRDRSNQAN